MSSVSPRVVHVRWLRWAGAFVVAVGAAAWLGWLVNAPQLASWVPAGPAMVLNTAFCVLLCGVGLMALDGGANRVAVGCGALVALFGFATQGLFFFGWSVGFDEALKLHQWLAEVPDSFRLRPNTVVALALLGAAIAARGAGWRAHYFTLGVCGVVIAFAFMSLVKFAGALGQAGPYEGMSVPTMISLLVMAAALLHWACTREPAPRTAALPLLAAAFGMMVSISVVSVQGNLELVAINQRVVRTHEVRGGIDHFVEQVARMESSARAFALTGGESFRARAGVHQREVVQKLGELMPLVADEPTQRARLAGLRALAEEKFAQSRELMRLREEGGVAAAAEFLAVLPANITSALVQLADEVRAEESRLLATREQARRSIERDTRLVQVLGSGLTLALLGAAVLAARRANAARRAAEEELRGSEERFRNLAAAAFEGIVISEHGRILDANPQALEMLRGERADLVGHEILAFVAPEDRDRVAEAVRTGREDVYEIRLRRKDGSAFPGEARGKVACVGGRTVRMTALRDITARKRAEAELRTARDEAVAAAKLKAEFLATMSHEIRTPMNGILGMAELLAESAADDEQREMARVIQRSAEGLLAIINDILDFSKIEAGKLRLEPQEFALRALVEETLALLAPRAQQKHLALTAEFDALPADRFLGDAGRIRQVLTHLVGNAIKFTERGAVTVRAEARPGAGARAAVRVSVRDTGIGIAPEAHARLFQPFTQVDGSATRRFGGTGLGLAISRQLVTLMGGDLGFASEPGRGSTFWFELSLARAAPRADPAAVRP